jgi:hypothetical protein
VLDTALLLSMNYESDKLLDAGSALYAEMLIGSAGTSGNKPISVSNQPDDRSLTEHWAHRINARL